MASRTVVSTPALAGTLGEAIAEFFGTMVLILFGDGCVASFALFTNLNGPGGAATPFANEWPVIIFGWGFAVMLGIYVVAAAILYFVYHGALVNAAGSGDFGKAVGGVFYTSPKAFVGLFGAFMDEFVGTALLVGLIFAIVDGRNQPVQANLNPPIIGFVVVAIGASFGLNSGYAINPARDFGPRLWVFLVSGSSYAFPGNPAGPNAYPYFWIPIVAPLLGGVVGGYIYDFTVGKVIEAKMLMKSGTAVTEGETVREPSPDAEIQGRSVREP